MKGADLNRLHQVLKKVHGDESFKTKLLKNPREVFESEGILLPKEREVKVVENTKEVFYIVIPKKTVPKEAMLKNLPKNPNLSHITAFVTTQIQQNAPLKEKLLKSPTEELAKLGIDIPKGLKIKLLLNTDKELYFVIPRKISEGEELHDLELQAVSGGNAKSFSNYGNSSVTTDGSHTSESASAGDSSATLSGNTVMGGGNTVSSTIANFSPFDF
ncbi:MAG: hypothetical protein S4CHLAM37_07760 [Chlamydiia bacterium]|nr:hypothetical protein [Chlamydiia bacterium]